MSQTLPAPLQVGDKVLIISPAGKIDKLLLKGLKDRLLKWGLLPIIGKHAAAKSSSFAGTIKQRLADLQYGLDSPIIKAIFCSRGGYGCIQLIDKLNFTKFRKNPKWLVGFSDITVLHSLFLTQGYASLHAPMARHLTVEPKDDIAVALMRKALFGNPISYIFKAHKHSQEGVARGILKGGNLSILESLNKTPLEITPEGTILYLEDVNLSPNSVQRMFYQLKLSGTLEKLSGLIIGQFTDSFSNSNISKEVYKAIYPIINELSCPICFDFPIGHATQNYPLINGATAELRVSKNTVELIFEA